MTQAVARTRTVFTGGPAGLVSSLVSSVSGLIASVTGLISTLSNLARTGGGGIGRLIGSTFPVNLLLIGLALMGFGVMSRRLAVTYLANS